MWAIYNIFQALTKSYFTFFTTANRTCFIFLPHLARALIILIIACFNQQKQIYNSTSVLHSESYHTDLSQMYKIITDWLTWQRDERQVLYSNHATLPKKRSLRKRCFGSPCPFLFKHDASTGSPDFPWLPDVLSSKK